jgi:hypothetical protein
MKYIYLIILILIILLCLRYNLYEGVENRCDLNKGITTNEDMRCIINSIYLLTHESEYELNEDNVIKDICYKVHEVYKLIKPIADVLKEKSESEIWQIWGMEKTQYSGGVEVTKPNTPILSSNKDYENFMKIFMYVDHFEILVEELSIWKEVEENDENGRKKGITRMCKPVKTLEQKQRVAAARNLLNKLQKITQHFFNQYNNYKMVYYGDSKDTKPYYQ